MTTKTRKAVNGSIKKWEGIRDGKVRDLGRSNCPLCVSFCRLEMFGLYSCVGCPVFNSTGLMCCDGTPYIKWDAAGGHNKTANTPKLKRLATAEINFLKSLLPKKGKK